ncbi:hypothetical protein VCHA47P369_50173 [Vibrio chagasii]|nr:hypothetical protein VCHA48P435_30226 [Vibrio chagasii]CAH7245465.1 hypothetical protein VCHA47P369_50173 [Vibrio chagasii]CAH7286427.1 hypothetical protein VCHA51O448_40173 [Vibrio chagasii]CAH7405599.1 hypothetical protein VCHA57P526_30221 [Vibrio chagasii]
MMPQQSMYYSQTQMKVRFQPLEYDSITQDLLSVLRKGPLKSPSILDGRQK